MLWRTSTSNIKCPVIASVKHLESTSDTHFLIIIFFITTFAYHLLCVTAHKRHKNHQSPHLLPAYTSTNTGVLSVRCQPFLDMYPLSLL